MNISIQLLQYCLSKNVNPICLPCGEIHLVNPRSGHMEISWALLVENVIFVYFFFYSKWPATLLCDSLWFCWENFFLICESECQMSEMAGTVAVVGILACVLEGVVLTGRCVALGSVCLMWLRTWCGYSIVPLCWIPQGAQSSGHGAEGSRAEEAASSWTQSQSSQ